MWGNDPCGTLFRLTIQVSSVLAHACLAVFTSNTLSFAGYVSLCHDIFFTMHRERDPECRPRHNFFRNLWARNRASASLENLKVQRLPILHTGLAEITESLHWVPKYKTKYVDKMWYQMSVESLERMMFKKSHEVPRQHTRIPNTSSSLEWKPDDIWSKLPNSF